MTISNTGKVEILDSREKILNELGVNNEGEITENKFKQLLGMIGKIDHKTLELFVPQIPNLNLLVKQNQDFILQSINSQNKIDEKAIEEFSKTKVLIGELLKRENLSPEETMFLLKLYSQTDERIDKKASQSGNRMKELITEGIKIGRFVALAIFAIFFSSRNSGGGKS
ncbi:hypothetical protein HNQ94_000025 [Salirhabdus euzebyi]|uniref:Uncharacterized protein n=1 Tax=Salirhabdus euzebyi TaxID=394506 RepID=A0A841PV57_9BACI|nr:hypothetical protein [Salirhabdus euzebyi]MBB6451604.1 hypothetical protein [Salirhabdus euzebyi]